MTAPPVSSLTPPVEIAPPDFTAYRYGILSAAQRVDEGGRWELGGVVYSTTGCPNQTAEWITRCPQDPPVTPAPEKNMPVGLDRVDGKPFTLYDAVTCYPQSGRTEVELLDLAEQSLIAGEQERIEEKVWAQIRAQAQIINPAGTPPGTQAPFSFTLGVGVLEHRIAQLYGGLGVLHAPRFLMALAHSLKVAVRDGDKMLSPGDNLWSFGAGYDTFGPPPAPDPPPDPPIPEDNPAPPGQAWMIGTGPILLRRAPVTSMSAFDTHSNERRALAERNYVLTVECPAIAVLIKFPER